MITTHNSRAITPCGHRILVELDPVEETSKGGIIIPETRTSRAARTLGTIVAIGPNAWKAFDDGTPWAKVGDRVMFSRFDGKQVKDPDHPEKDYQIINDDDIQCIYSKATKEHEQPREAA